MESISFAACTHRSPSNDRSYNHLMTDSEYISHDRTRREWARGRERQRAMTNGFYFDWFLPDVMCVSSHFSALCFAFWSFDFDSIRLISFLIQMYKVLLFSMWMWGRGGKLFLKIKSKFFFIFLYFNFYSHQEFINCYPTSQNAKEVFHNYINFTPLSSYCSQTHFFHLISVNYQIFIN